MDVLLACSDHDLTEALSGLFPDDAVTRALPSGLTEPDAFATVERCRPGAVVLVPDRTSADPDELRACWWLSRAADLAGVPVVLLSTAAVFDARDRRPRSEFDVADPDSVEGRRARAAELLVERTTRRAVVIRVGPLDVGPGNLHSLLTSPGGVTGGGDLTTTPAAVASLGPVVRYLAVARRYGVWHVGGTPRSMAECARALGLAVPASGDAPVPVPLDGQMMLLSGMPAVDPWPVDPRSVRV